jgi:DNA-binding MurR/RpiR family transcriptional regulator
MISATLNSGDSILAISNTGSNKELIENLTLARENGTKVISITSNNKAPIAKVSDVVLVSFGMESQFKSEAMESRISTLSLIDTLFVGVCLRDKQNYLDGLNKMREAIAKKRF